MNTGTQAKKEAVDHKRMLRVPEAASYLGISASTLNKMRVRGDGPTYIKLGKVVVYDTEDLDAHKAANRFVSTSEYGGEDAAA